MERSAILLVTLIGLSLAFGCRPDKDDYVENNQKLIDTLATFPGSHVIGTRSSEIREDEHGPVLGYGTSVEYGVPLGTTRDDVIDFYKENLTSWSVEIEDIPISPGDDFVRNARFRNGESGVSINTDNLFPANVHTYELSVDYRRFRE